VLESGFYANEVLPLQRVVCVKFSKMDHGYAGAVKLRARSALNGIAPNIFFPTLAFFTKRDGEGGIRLFAAQLPISVAMQLKKPCQSAAVRQDWRGDLERSDARGGAEVSK
jgi:hypothetical protein